jgi:hypothetical protein
LFSTDLHIRSIPETSSGKSTPNPALPFDINHLVKIYFILGRSTFFSFSLFLIHILFDLKSRKIIGINFNGFFRFCF